MKVSLACCAVALLLTTAVAQSQPAAQAPAQAPAAQAPAAPAAAPQAKPHRQQEPPTVTRMLDQQLYNVERHLVGAAEAMPEDKFDFKPATPGGAFENVKSFRQQLLHVAANNYLFADTLLGQPTKVTEADRENGPASITTKADAIKYLKESFEAAHKAMQTVNETNQTEVVKFAAGEGRMPRLFVANIFAWHGFDHYGQIAVYLRMNGIVPPASRGGGM